MSALTKPTLVRTASVALLVLASLSRLASGDETAPAYSPELTKSLALIDQTIAKGPYQPDWASLKTHTDPDWFRDDKFGIYTHWGTVTVGSQDGPDSAEWYGDNMYNSRSPLFKYPSEKFGDQNQVGYKDMIPKFTADKPFTAQDIRFTTTTGSLYAIALAVPTGELKIQSLGSDVGKVTAVSLLGSDATLNWKQAADWLVIQPVDRWPSQSAVTFKITLNP